MQTWRLFILVVSGLALGACQTIPEGAFRDGNETEADEGAEELSGDPDKDEEKPGERKYREYDLGPRVVVTQPSEQFPDRPHAPDEELPPIIYGEEIDGPAEEYIRIGSFNLKGFGPNKAEFRVNPRGTQTTSPQRNMAAFVAAYVDAMNLDVVAFQEVIGRGDGGLTALQTAMGLKGYALAVGNGDDFIRSVGVLGRNKERCPIFYRMATMGLEGNTRGKVKIAEINGRDRHATYAHLGVRADRVPADQVAVRFMFLMTCQHAPPPDRPVAERRKYWAAIPTSFGQIPAVDTDVIFAGDLNTDPRTTKVEEQQRFAPVLAAPPQGAGFSNSHPFANLRPGGGTTIRGDTVYDDLLWRSPTEPDYAGPKVVEYGFDAMFTTANGTVDKDAQNRFSDHYPVWAKFHRAKDAQ